MTSKTPFTVATGLVLPKLVSNQFKPIRDYHLRWLWLERLRHAKTTILAFYNTGKHLFVDPYCLPPTTYYWTEWKWMPYADFAIADDITILHQSIGSEPSVVEHVRFQHLGHNGSKVVQMIVGNNCNERTAISPLNVVYMATRNGIVLDKLVLFQPLPQRLACISSRRTPLT